MGELPSDVFDFSETGVPVLPLEKERRMEVDYSRDNAQISVSFRVSELRASGAYHDSNPVIGFYSPMCRQTVFMHGTREEFMAFIENLQDTMGNQGAERCS